MNSQIEKVITEIRADSVHGATFLTRNALLAIRQAVSYGPSREELEAAARQIAAVRPMMASLFNVSNRLLYQLDRDDHPDAVNSYCDDFLASMEDAAHLVMEKGVKQMEGAKSILTHSYSSLVCDTLLAAAERGRRFRVVCTESRPGKEGLLLARRLCEAGIEVSVVIDAAAGHMMNEVDLVLVGADGIGSFGLVHKMGTYPIALAARDRGVAFAVLATEEKFWPYEIEEISEPLKQAGEIAKEDGCFNVVNLYFDRTPLRKEDMVVMESAVLNGCDIRNICERNPLHPLLKHSVG